MKRPVLTAQAANARAYIKGPACANQSIPPSKSTQARQAHSAGEATMRPGDAHRASKISHRASKLGLAHAPLTDLPPAPAELSWSANLPLEGTGTRPSDSSSACDHSSHGCWVGARSNYVTRPTGSALLRSSKPRRSGRGFPRSPELHPLASCCAVAGHGPPTQGPARPTPPGAQRRHTDRAQLPHLSPSRSLSRPFLLRPSLTCSFAM